MHRQTLSSIKSLALSLGKKYTKKSSKSIPESCYNLKINLRMIYSFSKTVHFDDCLELFEIIIGLFQQSIKLDYFHFREILNLIAQYIEKFLEAYVLLL